MTDPKGCELLITKQPDRKDAIEVGLSDDQTVLNYGFDTNADGRVDLLVGYQLLPKEKWACPECPAYLPGPVVFWKDRNYDGDMDDLLLPVGGRFEDCRLYIHLYRVGEAWVLVTGHDVKVKQ